MRGRTYIIELDVKSAKLIMQALHIYKYDNPDSEEVDKAMSELLSQVDGLYERSEKNFVWKNGLAVPRNYTLAKIIRSIAYAPIMEKKSTI